MEADKAQAGVQPDIEMEAQSGLHQAIRQRDLPRVRILVQMGNDVNSAPAGKATPLVVAVQTGSSEIVRALLKEFNANVNSASGTWHETALHEAAVKGYVDIATILLEAGAKVNAKDSTGWTPLMFAVQQGHTSFVRLLLDRGANRHLFNGSGQRAVDIVPPGAHEISKLLVEGKVTSGPRIDGDRASKDSFSRGSNFILPPPPLQNDSKMKALKGFPATIVHFYIGQTEERVRHNMSVHDLLYGPGPRIMEQVTPSELGDSAPTFQWYHLPANNLEWAELLIQRHLSTVKPFPTSLVENKKNQIGLRRIRNATDATCKRPSCQVVSGAFQGRPDSYSLVSFMPYLHFETKSGAEQFTSVIDATRKDRLSKRPISRAARQKETDDNPHTSLVNGYMGGKSRFTSLQPRRTLDQYFYSHLPANHERQIDQVVKRSTDDDQTPKLFMVDQLWMWILNEDTVITCFPKQWDCFEPSRAGLWSSKFVPPTNTDPEKQTRKRGKSRPDKDAEDATQRNQQDQAAEPDKSKYADNVPLRREIPMDIHKTIMSHLKSNERSPITSAPALAALVVNVAANVFDPDEVPGDYQFFDFFEKSVSKVAEKSTELLSLFHIAMTNELGEESLVQKLMLGLDAKLLVEVEDIRDELDVLKMVLQDQKAVMDSLHPALMTITGKPAPSDELLRVDKNRVWESHMKRIERMEHVTDRTSQTLYRLIDLKQKHASVSEAMAANKSAEDQANQAAAATQQGRTLMLFTVVTILFLPLSFMSAFFAINIDAFPTNDDGDMELSYVVKYLIGISLAVSLPFILIVFNQDRMAGIFVALADYVDTIDVMGWISMVMAIIALITVWASELSVMASVTVTITAVLLVVLLLCGKGIYRLVHIARRTMTVTSSPTTSGSLLISGGSDDDEEAGEGDVAAAAAAGRSDDGVDGVTGLENVGRMRQMWRTWRRKQHGRRRGSLEHWMAEQGGQATDDSDN